MGYVRFLLAVTVLLVHLGAPVGISGFGGASAVEGFFFISGFLIASILSQTYKSKRSFYLNRFLRIFPLYWMVASISVVYILIASPEIGTILKESIAGFSLEQIVFTVLANVLILGSDALLFFNIDPEGLFRFVGLQNSFVSSSELLVVSPIWTVSLELVFYLIAPFILKASNRVLIFTTATLLLIRFSAYLIGVNDDPWNYRFFPFELPIFLLGALVFRFSGAIRNCLARRRAMAILVHPISFTMYFIAFGIYRSRVDLPRFLELCVLLLLIASVTIFGRVSKIDNFVGRLSYPIYISHYPLIMVFSEYQDQIRIPILANQYIWISIQVLLVIVVSYTLEKVTYPIELLRDRIRSKQ